jgi:hypothetical protein
MSGSVARIGKTIFSYKILVGKHGGEREFAKPRCRWEDNLKMDLKKWDVGV